MNKFVLFELTFFNGLSTKVHLEKGWNSKRMITEGEAAIPLETTRCAFRNQEKSKQRSAIVKVIFHKNVNIISMKKSIEFER